VEFAKTNIEPETETIDDPSREKELEEGNADNDLDRTSGESVTTVPGVLVVVLDCTEEPEDPEDLDAVILTVPNTGLGDTVFIGVVVVDDDSVVVSA
jgi:hypothetical protein